MTLWTDVATSTSTGTGTTNTWLNAGASLPTPTQAKTIVEVTPYQAPTAALTAAEGSTQRFQVSSTSLGSILPKNVVLTPILGGLGAFTGAIIPMLDSFRLDVRLPNANVPIDYYSQSLIANTAAFRVGATITYSDMPPAQPEQYYDTPTAMTSMGTAAATVAGTAIVVNNAAAVNLMYMQYRNRVVTASESYVGYAQFDSTDLMSIQRVRFAVQPVGVAVGATLSIGFPAGKFYPQALPVRPTATINNSYTMEEALTAAGDFIGCLGFVRSIASARGR